ncbi:MAG: ion transporter [Xanthomarina sp.]
MAERKPDISWKEKLYIIIYEADTPAGKLFDLVLIVTILASITLVMLESVKDIDTRFHVALNISEWVITILFSLEYIARIVTVKRPLKYITSFYGIIDLLSTLPKFISLIFPGTQVLVALRALRLLRVFRILKLTHFLGASNILMDALKSSRAKILVFLYAIVIISIILGTIMYLVEGEESGFTNIPKSIYWCVVTLTTVGFGDITPQTGLGQFIATLIMILGYGIIAVPTGIVTAEFTSQKRRGFPREADREKEESIQLNTKYCENCLATNHKDDAEFCNKCGYKI